MIPSKITIIKNSADPRSYNLDSSKLLRTGFKPKKKIDDAIKELSDLYKNGILKDQPNFHSIKWIKKNKIAVVLGSNSFSAGSMISKLLKNNYTVIGVSRSKFNEPKFQRFNYLKKILNFLNWILIKI